jgi:hypothetical protein
MTQKEDRALAEFRGFAHVASLYIGDVDTEPTLLEIEEIVAKIKESLQQRKDMLLSQ